MRSRGHWLCDGRRLRGSRRADRQAHQSWGRTGPSPTTAPKTEILALLLHKRHSLFLIERISMFWYSGHHAQLTPSGLAKPFGNNRPSRCADWPGIALPAGLPVQPGTQASIAQPGGRCVRTDSQHADTCNPRRGGVCLCRWTAQPACRAGLAGISAEIPIPYEVLQPFLRRDAPLPRVTARD